MRTLLRELLANAMHNRRVRLLTGDVGYGILDKAWDNAYERCINMGASEQAMIGTAVGMTYSNLIPICYSITPFLLYRPFEWIRNYLDHERAPVKLIAIGRDDDYKTCGFSHWAFNVKDFMAQFPNIRTFYPDSNEDLDRMWDDFLDPGPAMLSIPR